jgi:hypothetical protein
MCRAIVVIAALLTIPPGTSLDGQTASPSESELISRIDSLSVILGRADSVAKAADVVRNEEARRLLTARIDTFQVGPFFVAAPVGQAGLARRYFERAWARYAAVLGTEQTAIDGHVFIFGRNEQLVGLDGWGSTRVNTRFMSTDRDRAIGRILGDVMASDLPDDLQAWVGRFLISTDVTGELALAYRSLVTTQSVAVTDCYDDALDRCWDAMGLGNQDEWAAEWYTASERRSFVRRLRPSSDPRIEGARASCLDAQTDDACTALLVDRGAAASIPLPPGARMTLLAHALSLGGPEGYVRLGTSTEASIKNRLLQASGVSADSLISSWRAATFQARPDVHRDTKMIRWSSLFWLVVLAGFSTRSTRWRLT